MRITPQISDRTFLSASDRLNDQLNSLSQQVATGRRMIGLHDSPDDSARLVEMRAEQLEIDQYRQNVDSASFLLGVADSALSSAHEIVTAIFSRGSSAASGINDAATRAAVAADVRSMRDQLLSLANTEAQGRYIFAGSKVADPAFSLDGGKVTYQGDDISNRISVGESLSVGQGIAGGAVFEPAFEAVDGLISALDTNDTAAIQQSLTRFQEALASINSGRGQVGSDLGLLENTRLEQNGRESALRARQSTLEDADLVESITNLQRAQTQLQAALTVRTITNRQSLFDFLG